MGVEVDRVGHDRVLELLEFAHAAVVVGRTEDHLPESEPERESVTRIAGKAAGELYRLYVERGFVLDAVRQGADSVPRLAVERLPRELGALVSRVLRKTVFIKTLLP
ncbi:MAG: hypothetical protein ACKOEE_12580, partial [Tagaea sp.]